MRHLANYDKSGWNRFSVSTVLSQWRPCFPMEESLWFSGSCPAETTQPIKMNFCTIDCVGESTRCVKNGWNRLAGGSPTYRWNITSKTFLIILYLHYILFFQVQPCCALSGHNEGNRANISVIIKMASFYPIINFHIVASLLYAVNSAVITFYCRILMLCVG